MKLAKITYFLLAGALLACSCKSDHSSDYLPVVSPDADSVGSPTGQLVSVVRSENYTPDQLVNSMMPAAQFEEVIKNMSVIRPFIEATMRVKVLPRLAELDMQFCKELGTKQSLARQWQVESHVFTYNSVASDGSDIVLSGRVTFPNNKVQDLDHEVQTLTLYTHPAVPSKLWQTYYSLGVMSLRSLQNSAVIEPDLQGFGVTEGQIMFPRYLSSVLARQAADCATAALQVMARSGVRLAKDGYTTNWGGSQTAHVTARFHELYETKSTQQFRNAIRLHSTYVASNVGWDGIGLPRTMVSGDRSNAIDAFCDCIRNMSAMHPSDLQGYQLSDFLSDAALNQVTDIYGEQTTFYKWMTDKAPFRMIAALRPNFSEEWTLEKLVAPDMLSGDGTLNPASPKMQALTAAMTKGSKHSFYKIGLPIYLCQNPKDEMYSYEDCLEFYNEYSMYGTNPNVHLCNIPVPRAVAGAIELIDVPGYHLGSYLVAMLEMVSEKTPAEVNSQLNK